jgi:23S rRNA pseudouridine2605 synthase
LRLQRYLARTGLASRRKAEDWIRAGRVTVDGRRVADPAVEVGARAEVRVDGRRVVQEEVLTLLMHKPPGVMTTTRDPEGRRTVLDLLDRQARGTRLFPVGRLDYHTQGVLLLTNDGDLMQWLTHPSHRIERVYQAKLQGLLRPEAIDRLRRGVRLDDGPARPDRVRVLHDTGRHSWIEIALHEGRNRMVHRMAEAVGHRVLKLVRVSFAGLSVEDLPPGGWRPLSRREVQRLRSPAPPARSPERGSDRWRPPGPGGSPDPRRRRPTDRLPRRSSSRPPPR